MDTPLSGHLFRTDTFLWRFQCICTTEFLIRVSDCSPGAIVITLIPWLAKSLARGKVIPTTPPLDAEYAV